ncbi:hypothetical protein V8G54_004530, partial [Vigna mungo]
VVFQYQIMSKARKSMTKLEAVEYLKEVQKKFKDEKGKFEEFLKIMTDYRVHRIGVGTVVEKVMEILKNHDDLMLGFNKFLPKGYEILLPPKDKIQLKDAIKYVQKIKVEKLFEGHHDLVRDFTLFLPDA